MSTMTPARLRMIVTALDIPKRRVAELCCISPQILARYLDGHGPVPQYVERILELLVRLRRLHILYMQLDGDKSFAEILLSRQD
jgi:hypothetical protein